MPPRSLRARVGHHDRADAFDAVRASTITRASEPLRRRWSRLKGGAGRSAAR